MKPNQHSKQGGQFKLIRCDRCNVPTPYGSIHICDEADRQELPSDISCPKCFKKDKTYSALFECSCGNSWRIGLGWDNQPQQQGHGGLLGLKFTTLNDIKITASCGGSEPCKAGCSTHPVNPQQPQTEDIQQEVSKSGEMPQQQESWSKKKPTEAQKKHWESMRGYKGEKAHNWRGDNITIQSIHQWLNARYGKPQECEEKNCSGKSKVFDWAKKTGCDYIRDRRAFRRLCRSCHRKYDMTEKKKEQGEKNLWWNKSSYFSMKLTPDQVRAIKVELSKGVTMKKIAEQFGCHETNIWQISKGKIWKQI